MRELYRVFSITWQSEQDFCSKPFFWHHFFHLIPLKGVRMFYSVFTPLSGYLTWQSLTHGIAEAGSDCWWSSGPTLLNAGLSPTRSQIVQDHAQLCLELLQRMHLQEWGFPSPKAAPLPQCFFSPLYPTSISFAANLSRCLRAFLWASERAWLHPLSSQISAGEGQQLSSPFACSVCPGLAWYHHFGGSVVPIAPPGRSPSQVPQAALWLIWVDHLQITEENNFNLLDSFSLPFRLSNIL